MEIKVNALDKVLKDTLQERKELLMAKEKSLEKEQTLQTEKEDLFAKK